MHNTDFLLLIWNIKDDDIVREVLEPHDIETHEKVLPHRRTFQSTLL